ncbi:MAG: porin family protein [Bacteroidota bacterium]
MKLVSKVFLIVAFVFTGHFAAQAQLSFGGRVGVNLASVSGEDDNSDSKLGLDIAAVIVLPVSETFFIQPEVHFLQKGGKEEDGFSGQEIKSTLNYIQIPILAKYVFGDQETLGFYVLGGPSIGLGVGVKTAVGDNDATGSFEDAGFKAFDFGVDLGVGVLVPAGPGTFFIDVRYLLGLSNINDLEFGGDINNRGINFGVGFLAAIGG